MSDARFQGSRLVDQEHGLEATFVPAAGMLCSSLRHRGQELLAQNAGVSAYAERGKTMGIPLLYPWANRLADFGYEVAADLPGVDDIEILSSLLTKFNVAGAGGRRPRRGPGIPGKRHSSPTPTG